MNNNNTWMVLTGHRFSFFNSNSNSSKQWISSSLINMLVYVQSEPEIYGIGRSHERNDKVTLMLLHSKQLYEQLIKSHIKWNGSVYTAQFT